MSGAQGFGGPRAVSPVVLVHGLGVDHRMWSLQVPHLQQVGPVWAPDLPGFGACPPLPVERRTPEGYVDWLAARLRERGAGAVHVAGYSMGGTLALLLALRHPRRVRSLALCCSSPCWGRGARHAAAFAFGALGGRFAMEVFVRSVEWGFARYSADPGLRAEVAAMVRGADRATMLSLYHSLAGTDLRAEVPRVAAPALVVGGTRDWLAPPSHQKLLARALPRAELRLVKGGNHMLCAAQPEEFGGLLRRFFRDAGEGPVGPGKAAWPGW
ncbi:MAG: alpha/beta hydrolase [Deferrisomatales bacterium]|nr:alpha/beta hydrolase [Deferrisomatales bacterium]